MTKTILFDFDGTLVDTFPIIEKEVRKLKGIEKKQKIDFNEIKKLGTKGLIKKSGIPYWKIPLLTKNIMREIRNRKDIKLFEGVELILKQLRKRYRLGIVSSNSEENIKKILKENGVDKLFDYIYSASSLFGKHKNLKRLIKKYKLNLEEVIYVGDEDRDILAAKKVGIKVVAVTWGYNSKEKLMKEKPDYLVSSPKELEKIFKG
ncbi:MAG: HAD-IA family hydrolase [Nanoarchaeota archaeon]|nr:HAD-IA family hydrolase [Nanoarchaeota archaeon]